MCTRAVHVHQVLSVTLNDDEASSCLTMGFGGVVGTVTWWSSTVTAGIVVVVTMTAVFGHAGAPRRGLSLLFNLLFEDELCCVF